MRWRYLAFFVWFSVTVVYALMALSQFLFGRSGARVLYKRLLFALIWPLALLSPEGRAQFFADWSKYE